MKYIPLFLLIPVFCFGQLLTQIDNQILHLKGDVGITASGDSISVWADQSGGSNDFPQATGADQPEYISASYVDFDSSNTEYLARADEDEFSFGDGSSDEPFSIIAYVNMANATKFRIVTKHDGTAGTCEYIFCTDASDQVSLYLYDNASTVNINAVSSAVTGDENSWITVAATYDGGGDESGIIIYVDGSSDTTPGSNLSYTAMHNTNENINIGFLNWTNDYADGFIQDIIMTSDVLTPDEVTNIHTYFTTGTYPEGYENRFKRFKDFNKFKRH